MSTSTEFLSFPINDGDGDRHTSGTVVMDAVVSPLMLRGIFGL